MEGSKQQKENKRRKKKKQIFATTTQRSRSATIPCQRFLSQPSVARPRRQLLITTVTEQSLDQIRGEDVGDLLPNNLTVLR
jgi:hypothetical protein